MKNSEFIKSKILKGLNSIEVYLNCECCDHLFTSKCENTCKGKERCEDGKVAFLSKKGDLEKSNLETIQEMANVSLESILNLLNCNSCIFRFEGKCWNEKKSVKECELGKKMFLDKEYDPNGVTIFSS
ncbi:MAG: hypothetical protein ACRCU3_08425 [Eubacteriaceae bacterium]